MACRRDMPFYMYLFFSLNILVRCIKLNRGLYFLIIFIVSCYTSPVSLHHFNENFKHFRALSDILLWREEMHISVLFSKLFGSSRLINSLSISVCWTHFGKAGPFFSSHYRQHAFQTHTTMSGKPPIEAQVFFYLWWIYKHLYSISANEHVLDDRVKKLLY